MILKQLISVFIALGFSNQIFAQECSISPANQQQVSKLSTGNLDFALNVYKSLSKADQNLFFSPFSLSVALAMTSSGAEGDTHQQLKDALHLNQFQTQSQIEQAFQAVLNSTCSNGHNYSLSTANGAFIQRNFDINAEYVDTLKQFYNSTAENVDFSSSSDQAAAQISQWVEAQTNGTIKNLFPPNSIDPRTILILVNAIYFKGAWQIRFDPLSSKRQSFRLASGQQVQAPMMSAKDFFSYHNSSELRSQVLELNYAGERLAMIVILPWNLNGLLELGQNLTSKNLLLAINNVAHPRFKVNVKFPKFQLKFREKLSVVLKSLGVVDMFDAAKANLSKINEDLVVSEVVHQAFVDVDEKGSTASAASGVEIFTKSFSPEISFNADHPFMFIIYDKLTELALFIGNVNNPLKQ